MQAKLQTRATCADGPGAGASKEFSGVLDLAPRNIVDVGAHMPFAKRIFCICIGASWGHPHMCIRSLNKQAIGSAGACSQSQAVLEDEPAEK